MSSSGKGAYMQDPYDVRGRPSDESDDSYFNERLN